MSSYRIRHILLPFVALAVISVNMAACAAPTPEVIEKEVVVEKEVPVTVEVEKEVVVERVVTATPMKVTATPTPSPSNLAERAALKN